MCAKGLEDDDEVWGINVGVKGQIIYLCIGDGRTEKLVYINLFIQMSIKLKPNSTRLMLVFIFTHCSTGGRSGDNQSGPFTTSVLTRAFQIKELQRKGCNYSYSRTHEGPVAVLRVNNCQS